ncbi:ATP-binding protein [Candidatus Latescibacterota bacterium]
MSLAELFKTTPDEVIGRTDLDFFEPSLARQKYEDDLAVIETQRPLIGKEEVDAVGAGTRWVSTTKLPWYGKQGEVVGLLGISRDITERKRLEREVIHLERMRVSGELAAGVSHNLNNMLTAVLGPAQILLRKSDDPQIRREAETILAAGHRAQDLVARLQQSVRLRQETTSGAVSLDAQVQEVVQMSRPQWKDEPESRGVSVEVAAKLGDTPTIRGNAPELDDAIMNLLLNAVRAMPEGGTIAIATQSVEAGGVQLTVSDTGVGMDEETCCRVFEPFFTTKRDVGSGLGLSTVHGTVTRWGGTIEVDSTPGAGTTFTVWFPAWTESASPVETTATPVSQVRPGKLLIVEDDEDVCGVLHRLLSETHTVKVVRDGIEALDQFVPGQYDVALIDLGMPGLAGDQVAARMRRLDPSVATVLITGWVLEQDDVRLAWFDLQIPKPFDDLDEVESVVAQAMALRDERDRRLPSEPGESGPT